MVGAINAVVALLAAHRRWVIIVGSETKLLPVTLMATGDLDGHMGVAAFPSREVSG